VTFIVRASKNDEVTITVRLRAVAAIAKAQSLSAEGWDVVIIALTTSSIHRPSSTSFSLFPRPEPQSICCAIFCAFAP
jgi:hypothetical protein